MIDGKKVLDAACGGRSFWFDKEHDQVLYIDNRTAEKGHIENHYNPNHEVQPDVIADFRDLPFPDAHFKLVVFDPPHLHRLNESSIMAKKYGVLNAETWPYDLGKGFEECWRVLDDNGVLVFKWNEAEIPLPQVLDCFSHRPLFGHPTAKHGKTHWCVFMKGVSQPK